MSYRNIPYSTASYRVVWSDTVSYKNIPYSTASYRVVRSFTES